MTKYLAIGVALVSFGAIASADTFAVLPDRGTQAASSTFDIIDWGLNYGPANNFSVPSSDPWVSFGGATGTITSTSGQAMAREDQGFAPGYGPWFGNFDGGETLLWNQNIQTNPADGTIVTFDSAVNSVGVAIQSNYYGTFTGQLQVYGVGHVLLGTLALGGLSNDNSDGSALFLGLDDLSGANITSIDIQTYNSVDANDFAIDDISFTADSPANVPEPTSVVLLASVVLCVAGLLRRKLSEKTA